MTDENCSGQPVKVSAPSLETRIDDIIRTKVQYLYYLEDCKYCIPVCFIYFADILLNKMKPEKKR